MLDETKRKELIAAHGAIGEWDTPDGRTVVVSKPSAPAYRAFIAKITKETANREAEIRDLVRSCVVYPDGVTADAIFEEYPAGPLELSAAVTTLAGGGGDGVRIRKN